MDMITLKIIRRNVDPIYEIKLKKNNKLIGYIEMEGKDDYLHIGNIEIIEKKEGYGRIIITDLLKEYCTLHGNSLYNAMGFWERMGAEFLNKPIPGATYGMHDGNFEFLIKSKNEVIKEAVRMKIFDK